MLTKEELEVMLKMALETIKARERTIHALLEKLQQPEEKKMDLHVLNDGVATRPL